MKTVLVKKIRKKITANVLATDKKVIVRFPKQLLQTVAVEFEGKIIKQWEIFILGDTLKVEVVK